MSYVMDHLFAAEHGSQYVCVKDLPQFVLCKLRKHIILIGIGSGIVDPAVESEITKEGATITRNEWHPVHLWHSLQDL